MFGIKIIRPKAGIYDVSKTRSKDDRWIRIVRRANDRWVLYFMWEEDRSYATNYIVRVTKDQAFREAIELLSR